MTSFEKSGGGASEPLIAELNKCVESMERDLNECDKMFLHISRAKFLVHLMELTKEESDNEVQKLRRI